MGQTRIKLTQENALTVNADPEVVRDQLNAAARGSEAFISLPTGSDNHPTWIAVAHVIEFAEALPPTGRWTRSDSVDSDLRIAPR
ncbi:MAG: hypothetical protein J7513_04745 [Solirubrobacteraceae bacterium]|nr:hypothetical protein [Solirubrobacteraceae bacterium]